MMTSSLCHKKNIANITEIVEMINDDNYINERSFTPIFVLISTTEQSDGS